MLWAARVHERHRSIDDPMSGFAKQDSEYMLFRFAIVAAFVAFTMNMRLIVGNSGGNAADKLGFLIAALLAMTTRPQHIFTLMLLALNLLLVFWLGYATSYPDFKWSILLLSLNQFIIIYALLAFKPEQRDAEVIIVTIAFVPILSAVLGLLYQLAGLHALFSIEYASGVWRFSGSLIPAYLSGMAMCGSFSALFLALAQHRSKYWLVFVANIMILLLAGGRAALAVTIIMCAACLFWAPGVRMKEKLWTVGLMLFALPAFAAVFGPKLVERFIKSGDNGREMLGAYVSGLADEYPWTGIGFGHQFFATPNRIRVMTGTYAAHDDYLRLEAEIGKIGMPVMYGLMTLAVLRASWTKNGPNVIVLTAWAGFLFLSMTDNVLAGPAYFPLIVVAAMALHMSANPEIGPRSAARPPLFWRMRGAAEGKRSTMTRRRGQAHGIPLNELGADRS